MTIILPWSSTSIWTTILTHWPKDLDLTSKSLSSFYRGSYRVPNKRRYIYRRLLIQIGISFLLYYGCVLDAKGCQFIISFAVLWNSTWKMRFQQPSVTLNSWNWANTSRPGPKSAPKNSWKTTPQTQIELLWPKNHIKPTAPLPFQVQNCDPGSNHWSYQITPATQLFPSSFKKVEFHKTENDMINWQPSASKTRP